MVASLPSHPRSAVLAACLGVLTLGVLFSGVHQSPDPMLGASRVVVSSQEVVQPPASLLAEPPVLIGNDEVATAAQLATQTQAQAILPDWMQSVRRTVLYGDVESDASTAVIPQWQHLRVREATATRLRVEAALSASESVGGWVAFEDVAISGPPPRWLRVVAPQDLYADADASQVVQPLSEGADLMVVGPVRGGRIAVYLLAEPTARRSSLGWVGLDGVEERVPPDGVALPGPGLQLWPASRADVLRIRPGDTVAAVAARRGISLEQLAIRYRLDLTQPLFVGQALVPPQVVPEVTAAAPRQAREGAPRAVSASHAVVVDEASGQVLWERNGMAPIAPASLTKIATSLVALDYARPGESALVRVDSRLMRGSTVMGLAPGEQLTVEELLYGLMLPSGNDAALALAEHVAGTREAFADLMNAHARALGARETNFVNPHGLDASGHVSSPFDMVLLAREGMRYPLFQALATAKTYDARRTSGYYLTNLNQLLWRYPGADGIKIGFTNAAGRAIVGSATRDGHRVYVALMRSSDLYGDAAALLDWAFSSFTWAER